MITALGNIGNVAGYRCQRWNSWYKIPYDDYSGSAVSTPAPEEPQPSTGGYIEYSIVKGNASWSVAQKYLGAGARYTQIMSASGLPKDATIYVGQVLKIPSKDQPPSAKPKKQSPIWSLKATQHGRWPRNIWGAVSGTRRSCG